MEKDSHPHILSGLAVRESIRGKLKEKVSTFLHTPKLVIIQIGDREDSNIYIKQKINFGKSIGVDVNHIKLFEEISEHELKVEIEKYNKDDLVTGIIIQLPLPNHIPKSAIDYISPKKDVDCITTYHQEKINKGDGNSAPATAKAILSLLDYYEIPLKGKNVVVIGRSILVGNPTAKLLEARGAIVSVIHSKTLEPKSITKNADVLVVACGVPHLVDSDWIDPKNHTVVIDVGIHRREGKIVGDVNYSSVSGVVSAISPVPGGVGPLTVAGLFDNVVNFYESKFMLL